ncbi:MAG: prephenate dehydratase [Planctomycetota bacterium]
MNSSTSEDIERLEKIREIDRRIEELLSHRGEVLAGLRGDPKEIFALGLPSHPIGVAYLGPQHSYSYAAASKYFGVCEFLHPVSSISAVFEEVQRGQSRYGVVPIENSTDGRIVDTMSNFIRSPIQICGEVLLPIHHNLLSNCQRSEIRKVYSKPQAISQCRRWLSEHLPDAQRVEVASTTEAAKIAREQPGSAAIASVQAAQEYSLVIVCKSIEDDPNNATRFAIIGKDYPRPSGNDKTSLLFQVPHQPGALADAMLLFRDNQINLTWIESLPVPGAPNEYFFFVELDGHIEQRSLNHAIESLKLRALRLDILGSYARGS